VLKEHDLTFISRGLGHNLLDIDSIVEYSTEFDIFINSTNIPNKGQTRLLSKLYEANTLKHIINISTTSVYWNNQKNLQYYEDKLELETLSKQLSVDCIESGKTLRVSCIAFGALNSDKKQQNPTGRKLMDLDQAAFYVKMIVESPETININYICLDPIQ
jgi:NADP-dependent 3-hydroxy acid dehydrogenase YdfG